MTLMTRRLQHDWFRRYVLDPQEFRPGTRMPWAWPGGQTFFASCSTAGRIADRSRVGLFVRRRQALVPYGLSRGPIELDARQRGDPVSQLYRRGRAAGDRRGLSGKGQPGVRRRRSAAGPDLAGRIHRRGQALDRSRHGFQPPLGDNVCRLAGPAVCHARRSARRPGPIDRPRRWATGSAVIA